MRRNTPIDDLANSYFQEQLNLDPLLVTETGLPGADETTFPDFSPEGTAELTDLNVRTLKALAALDPNDDVDVVTKAALTERLNLSVDLYEEGETSELTNISSPLQEIQSATDNMAQETREDWEKIAVRISNVAEALEGWRLSLQERAENGPELAIRQIDLAVNEAAGYGSAKSPYFDLARTGAAAYPELAELLEENARSAAAAYAELADFLRTDIAPHGVASDAFGRERYARLSQRHVGATVDLDETYEWGVAELERIIAEQDQTATELYGSGITAAEAMERLNADPAYQIKGKENLRAWMQETSDAAVAALNGTHFDIPEPMARVECMIAPSATGAIYYTPPTADFSRPGRMWWSVPEGSDTFATWQERTTVYHEGVPGHHLQIGSAVSSHELNTWRRLGSWVSGHGEGWALYAESLMRELGFQDDPGNRMGVLDSERLRAARVVLDIGVHLVKPSPVEYRHISPVWNRDVAWEFLKNNVAMDRSFLLFELNRYLGWAGQAPAYKIGERMWHQMRADAAAKATAAGETFDLKAWHMKALALGSLSLDVMKEAL